MLNVIFMMIYTQKYWKYQNYSVWTVFYDLLLSYQQKSINYQKYSKL